VEKAERIQIPISSKKKQLLKNKSKKLGFESITDSVRFLINSFLNGSIKISISTGSLSQFSKEEKSEISESIAEKKRGRKKKFNPSDKDFHKKIIQYADE
jgi:hypothetical protein